MEENKLENIVEILKKIDYKGTIYSPALWGYIEIDCVTLKNEEITVHNVSTGVDYYFDQFGRLKLDETITSKEVLLFPSKDDKNWKKFKFEEGDILVSDRYSDKIYVFRDEYTGNLKSIESIEGHIIEISDLYNNFKDDSTLTKVSNDATYYKTKFAEELFSSCFGSALARYLFDKKLEFNLKVKVMGSYLYVHNGEKSLGQFYLGTISNDYQYDRLTLG